MTELFTLLSQTSVRLSPGQKIVKAEEFATLQNAADILQTAEQEITAFKAQAAQEAEDLKEKARQEGFQEGLTSLNKHLLALDKELKTLREEVQKKILPLALSAARKLFGEEMRLHPDRIVDIVLTALKPVTQHKRVIIYVNKADLPLLEEHKGRIKQIFEHLDSFSFQDRTDVEPGGCMIETEAGIINAQLENQWKALEAAFEAFMKK
jgi:type III secretion protein L